MNTLQNLNSQLATQKPLAGWLCASDVDGTLVVDIIAKLPKVNVSAIERFRSLGGRFTIASGRPAPSVAKLMKRLGLEETPAVVLNGAGVYDCATNKMLRYNPIPEEGVRFALELLRKFPKVQFQAHCESSTHIWNPGFLSYVVSSKDLLPRTFHRSLNDLPREGWGKAIFFGKKRDIRQLKDYCKSLTDAPVYFMESSSVTFEILAPQTHKGTALLELADMLGIDKTHTAAIGNYDNDTGMIETAAVTAAMGNAPKSFQAKAQHVVRREKKGGVAEFLGILEKKIAF